jgi:RNA polymerase sigma-70 factor (ECF subfamily)
MTPNHEKFAALFNELYPKLCRFPECLLGERGSAQDIAQESFLQLYRFGTQRLPAEEARFWLFRVARNLALNELNKRQTRLKLFHLIPGPLRPEKLNPEAELESAEQSDWLWGLLKSLPEHQRTILLLREQEEMSYREIARLLNISESKVKVDIFRARCALRKEWEQPHGAAANVEKHRRRNQV